MRFSRDEEGARRPSAADLLGGSDDDQPAADSSVPPQGLTPEHASASVEPTTIAEPVDAPGFDDVTDVQPISVASLSTAGLKMRIPGAKNPLNPKKKPQASPQPVATPVSPEAKDAKPAGGGFSKLFGRKKGDGAPAEVDTVIKVESVEVLETSAPDAAAPKTARAPFWKSKERAAGEAIDARSPKALSSLFKRKSSGKASSDSSPSKPAKKAAAGAAAAGLALDLLTELDGGRTVFWRLGSTGLAQSTAEGASQVASFTRSDVRIGTGAAVRMRAATDSAVSELGEPARVVNASARTGAVYATTAERVKAVPYRLSPGALLIDSLLAQQPADAGSARDRIVGVLLDGPDTSLVILFHRTRQGELVGPQIAVNPNMEFVVEQFIQKQRLDVDTTEVILFRNDDLLAVAAGLTFYPNADLWAGLPTATVLSGLAIVALSGAAAAGFWAWQGKAEGDDLRAAQSRLTASVTRLESIADAAISGALPKFALSQSLSAGREMARATALWLPGSTLTLNATPAQTSYSLSLPLSRSSFGSGRPSVLDLTTGAEVEQVLSLALPEGCSKSIPALTGGLNAIQVDIVCQSPDSALGRYRLD